MSRLTTAIVSRFACGTANTVQVPDDRRAGFFKLIGDLQSAKMFLDV